MNEKCAGGSGKFLQVIARILHMKVEDIGRLSLAVGKSGGIHDRVRGLRRI